MNDDIHSVKNFYENMAKYSNRLHEKGKLFGYSHEPKLVTLTNLNILLAFQTVRQQKWQFYPVFSTFPELV